MRRPSVFAGSRTTLALLRIVRLLVCTTTLLLPSSATFVVLESQQIQFGQIVTAEHSSALALLNSDFELTVEVAPTGTAPGARVDAAGATTMMSSSTPTPLLMSQTPLYATANPTRATMRGLSIGHGSSRQQLEVRLCDGVTLSTFVFRHAPFPDDDQARQVRTLRVQRAAGGRNVTLLVNGHAAGQRVFSGVSGDIYDADGVTFGRVWELSLIHI